MEHNFYIDGYLKSNLDIIKDAVLTKDFDCILCVDGRERGGKSVLAQQIAWYLDNSFDIDRCVFTPQEFKSAVLKASPHQCIVYDEALTGFNIKGWATAINQALISMLAEIGQKQLFIIIVCPTSFDLEKYIILWRSIALINIRTKGFERGYFYFYNIDRKKELYIYGKKFYNYNCVKPNFWGRFINYYTLNETEYRQKKLISLSKKDKEEGKGKVGRKPKEITKEIIINNMLQNFTHQQISIALGISLRHTKQLIAEIKARDTSPTVTPQDIQQNSDEPMAT